MKIQGPNPLINAYRNQSQKQAIQKNDKHRDELNISAEAKKLQKNDAYAVERSKYVAEIKKLVQSGEYKVDYDKTAQEMIDFWSKR